MFAKTNLHKRSLDSNTPDKIHLSRSSSAGFTVLHMWDPVRFKCRSGTLALSSFLFILLFVLYSQKLTGSYRTEPQLTHFSPMFS